MNSNNLSVAQIEPKGSTPEQMRSKICALEEKMLEQPQVEIKTTHYYAPQIYMRQIFIPRGTLLTGKIHKTEHLNILSQGIMTVWTDEGMKKLKASTVIKSKPGIKRVGYAHEDSVWITVHHNPDNIKDTDALEEILIAKSFEEVIGSTEVKKIMEEK